MHGGATTQLSFSRFSQYHERNSLSALFACAEASSGAAPSDSKRAIRAAAMAIAAWFPSFLLGVAALATQFWQRRTNVWRKATNPARGVTRLIDDTANERVIEGSARVVGCKQSGWGSAGFGARDAEFHSWSWWQVSSKPSERSAYVIQHQ